MPEPAHARHDHRPDPTPVHGALRLIVVGLTLGALVGLAVLWPRGEGPRLREDGSSVEYVDATVVEAADGTCPGVELDSPTTCQNIVADVTSGATEGGTARFSVLDRDFSVPELDEGDDVVLLRNETAPADQQYSYADQQRQTPLLGLFVLFAVAVVAFGRLVGVRALVSLAASLAVVLVFILPALIRDGPALPVAFTGTVVIALVALYVTHGITMRTTVALLGTLASVLVVGLLAWAFVHLTRLTGLVDESAQVLVVTAEAIDVRGLLIAGVIIGALGVLDDVTVTQVAAVQELRAANPRWSPRQLYLAAVRIGRDHVASTVNTLVLAYVGASLPLLLFFLEDERSLGRVATSEIVAVEVVRTLVGSIGLVLAVPFTTALAAVALRGDEPPPEDVVPSEAPGPRWTDFSPEVE